jgi:corrinoid protein of di/trimethylamine methyltransferase
MTKEEILDRLSFSIVKADKEMAKETAQEIIKQKVDPIEAIEKGLSKGMDIVGERFSKMEAFLPELMMAAQTFDAAMEILEPEIAAQKKKATTHGTIVMGTVKGDVHNIGKNIVAMVLKTGGFDVHDLGVDVSPLAFVEAAQENRADIIALSSMMTTTMPGQREVIEILKEMGLRDRYCVIVGGGPVNQQWADQIGADGYGETAPDAVLLARDLLAERKK